MAHYALLDENNIVVSVITGRDETETVEDITDWEGHYSAVTGFRVLRTSYNTRAGTHLTGGVPYRYNYAGIGYTFDETKGTDGAFIPPKPFDSWVLDEATCLWQAPIPYPEDGAIYTWDEDGGDWVEVVNETT